MYKYTKAIMSLKKMFLKMLSEYARIKLVVKPVLTIWKI